MSYLVRRFGAAVLFAALAVLPPLLAAAGDARETARAAQPAQAPAAAPLPEEAVVRLPDEARTPPAGQAGLAPPMAMVRQMKKDTELPAMRLSLALINFVGDVDPLPGGEGGNTFAILPLAHESLLEVYDIHMEGGRVETEEEPHVRRMLGSHQAYVLRIPEFGSAPSQVVCVTSHGRKRCWNPGFDDLGGDFIRWSSAKGIK